LYFLVDIIRIIQSRRKWNNWWCET